jgi:hypothetical protein
MQSAVAVVLVVALTGAAVVFTHQDKSERYPQGLPWTVAAPKDVRWELDCRFVPVRLQVNPYDAHDWVNEMAREGSGPLSGTLPGDDGRCTLTKRSGAGAVRLTLVQNGVAHTQATDTGREPARVQVF